MGHWMNTFVHRDNRDTTQCNERVCILPVEIRRVYLSGAKFANGVFFFFLQSLRSFEVRKNTRECLPDFIAAICAGAVSRFAQRVKRR